jgi:hypothetical protein
VVPPNLVPSYTGPSTYLLLTQYNNYGSVGGDGINKLAIADPNVSMVDGFINVAGADFGGGVGVSAQLTHGAPAGIGLTFLLQSADGKRSAAHLQPGEPNPESLPRLRISLVYRS